MDVRENLAELIKEGIRKGLRARGDDRLDYSFEDVADYLIDNGVTVQEWIPVAERLPEPGERVLATDGGFVGELYVNSRGQWQRYNVNDHSLLMALDILWWMPLPEPPKGE